MEAELSLEPGIHKLTFEEYLAVDAVNASRLSDFRRSPAACRLRMDAPDEPTRAMVLGTAVHAALLEADNFGNIFAPFEYDGRTKEGKAERARMEAENVIGLPADDYTAALAMAQSLYTHPRIRRLLDTATGREQSAFWTEPRKGRLCKARRDLVGQHWIADLKTTSDLDRFSPWAVTDLGYYRQAAWYTWGAERLGETVEHFFFPVVSNSAPFESALFVLGEESLMAGRREMEKLLAAYLQCEAEGSWPRHVPALLTAEVSGQRLNEINEA